MREDVPSSMHSRTKRGAPAHGRKHFGHDPIFYKRIQRESRLSQLWSEEGTYEDRGGNSLHIQASHRASPDSTKTVGI